MVQSTSLIVAVATATTLLYTATPAFGAAVPLVRRDGMELVTRSKGLEAKLETKVEGLEGTIKQIKAIRRLQDTTIGRLFKLLALFAKNKGGKGDKKLIELITKYKKGFKAEENKKGDANKDSEKGSKDKKPESFKKKARDVDDSDLVTRDLEHDDLFVRDFEDDDLFARDFDEDELAARDFEDDALFTRDFDEDELVARELEGLTEIEARDLMDSLNDLEARDFDEELYERSDVLDELD